MMFDFDREEENIYYKSLVYEEGKDTPAAELNWAEEV